jgi:hypothetical protein
MSLKALPIPEETARLAHAAFPRGHGIIQLRETASNDLQ